MTTAIDKPKAQSPAVQFRQQAQNIAGALLKDWVGETRAAEAVGRISAAFAAAAQTARDPSDYYACTPQSVGQCIAIAALTGIMPGSGSTALAYVVPQRPRKGEAPQLQFMFSHRGLSALARRCGQHMIAIPIGQGDELRIDVTGDVFVINRDLDNPPLTEAELCGVVVVVKDTISGNVITSQYVSKKLIDQRRALSRAGDSKYGPWSNWYVEMAMKTSLHYAIGRGWCVIDDTAASRAMTEEQLQDLPVREVEEPRGVAEDDKGIIEASLEQVAARLGLGRQPDWKDEFAELLAETTDFADVRTLADLTCEQHPDDAQWIRSRCDDWIETLTQRKEAKQGELLDKGNPDATEQ